MQKRGDMLIRFDKRSFVTAIIIFVLLVFIAVYTRGFVRGFIGDILVMFFMYYSVLTLFRVNKTILLLLLFLFSIGIEIGQYFEVVKVLGLEGNKIASTVIGTTFDIKDIIAYAIGTILIYILNKI